ncbi:MFS transporter [Lactovum odontotermitis]
MFSIISKSKNFRYFFFADIVSGFGVGMGTVGGNWYILSQMKLDRYVGLLLAVNVLASFLISPLSGLLIDKMNRKNVIFMTFVFRAVVLSMILAMFYFFGFNLLLMYLYAAVNGIGWTVYLSASRSFIQEILPSNSLSKGNSLVEISLQVGMFAAGAASGVIYSFSGFNLILTINIITFIISGVLISRVSYRSVISDNTIKDETIVHNFKSGFEYLKKEKLILFLGIVSIIPLAVTMLYNVVLPSYVTNVLKSNSITFGISDMSYGIGGLLSGVLISSFSKKSKNTLLIKGLYIIAVLDLLVLGGNDKEILIFIGSLLLGVTNSGLRITINTELMQKVNPKFMGRSMAFWNGLSLFDTACRLNKHWCLN